MKKRSPYFQRLPEEKRPGLTIQDRDKEILRAVMDHRFISSSQLKALFWWIPERVLQRRLRKLYENKFLNRPKDQKVLRIMEDLNELIYSLDTSGVTLLASHLGIDRKKLKWQAGSANSSYLRHSLMVSKFRVTLTLATQGAEERSRKRLRAWASQYLSREGEDPSLEALNNKAEKIRRQEEQREQDNLYRFYEKRLDANVSLTDWKKGKQVANDSFYHKRDNQREVFPLRPDGYFVLQFANKDKSDHWFLECDRGTESGPRFKKKLETYSNFRSSRSGKEARDKQGIPKDFRLLTVTEDKRRADYLTKVTKNSSLKRKNYHSFWYGVETSYSIDEPETILERNFRTLLSGEEKSLLPETT